MTGMEIAGWAALAVFVVFIGYRVKKAKEPNPPTSGGGPSWQNGKYPNQDKK